MKWIVVQTKPNSEKKAMINLLRQGYSVFLPQVIKRVYKFNRFSKSLRPLFPGYIFVSIKQNQCWSPINNTYGVLKILNPSNNLYFLPIEVIKNIKSRCCEKGIFNFFKNFSKGQKVKILKKEINLDAVFEENIDEKRSFVFLEFLKQKVKCRVQNDDLEVVI